MNFCLRSVEETKFGRKERKKKWMEGKWHNLDKCVEDVGLAVEGGEVKKRVVQEVTAEGVS